MYAVLILNAGALLAADSLTRLDAKPGQHKVRIEGTSSLHPEWQMESTIIGGYLEVGPNFPLEPGQEVKPGNVEARGEAFIPVRSFKSIEKDGTPYEAKMDERMYKEMKQPANPRILYRLSELVLKETPKTKESPYIFDSKGELVIAGVTNKISMLVNVAPLGDKKVKITGNTSLKMTAFGIQPPSLIPGVPRVFKTGDDVKIFLEWTLYQKPAAAANK